jgi:hypothetical protein
LGARQLIKNSLAIYLKNFKLFIGISLVLLPLNIILALGQAFRSSLPAIAFLIVFPAGLFLSVIRDAAIAFATNGLATGSQTTLTHTYSQVTGRLQDLFWATARVFGALFVVAIVGTCVVVVAVNGLGDKAPFMAVPACLATIGVVVWLSVRWAFIPQTIMIQGANDSEALSLSADIVRGKWWHVFRLLVLLWIITFAFSTPALVSFLPAVRSTPIMRVVLTSTLSPLLTAFSAPFFASGLTLLFYDLRDRKPLTPTIADTFSQA